MVKRMNKELKNVKILGTGSYVPEKIVTNDDLSKIMDTSDEWIYSRTGIRERRISEGENTSELAAKAALEAIKASGINVEDIDLLIVATCSPDMFVPSTACLVQASIGAVNATCFDVSAACTGFIYGLNIATQFIRTGQSKTALVIGAEVLSKMLDWTDRSTSVLFGDGAGAAVLTDSEEEGVGSIFTKSDGVKGLVLKCEALDVINPYASAKERTTSYLSMEGGEVFKFAVKAMEESVQNVLSSSGYSLEDINLIIPHQANKRIIDSCAKRMKVDESKFYVNLHNYANTSAATIPIALDEVMKKGLIQKGDKVILVGFGGGLTWGAALISF